MTRLVLQRSLREPGHIVNLGSIAGRWAYPNGATYVTSKFAVRGFTRALREDLLGRDIRVTTVDSGLVETEFSVVRFRGDEARRSRSTRARGRSSAEDVADCDPLRGHAAGARRRRRARADVDRPVERRPHPPAHRVMLTILEGSTFCISDDRGDIGGETGGLFAQDTRRLSRFVLTINGQRPLLLSSGPGRVLLGRVLPPQPAGRAAAGRALDRALALRRRVAAGADRDQERVDGDAALRRRARAGLRLRGHLLGQAARLHARRPGARDAAAAAACRPTGTTDGSVCFVDGDDTTQVLFSPVGRPDGSNVTWSVELGEPRALGARGRGARRQPRRRRPQRAAERSATSSTHVRDSLVGVAPARAAGERELGHARATSSAAR